MRWQVGPRARAAQDSGPDRWPADRDCEESPRRPRGAFKCTFRKLTIKNCFI